MLKPCPFCGGEACSYAVMETDTAYLICDGCKVRFEYKGDFLAGHKLTELWNRRTPDGDDALRARIDELENELLAAKEEANEWSIKAAGYWQDLQQMKLRVKRKAR